MSDDPHIVLASDSSFLPEVWSWFAVGVTVILLRYIVRIRAVGFRGFQGDDYIAILSLALYTADAILVDICYHKGTNVDVEPSVVDLLTDSEIKAVKEGSKAQIAAWYTYTGLIWCMKFMLLFFYQRLTIATFESRLVRYCFWMCGITYVAVFLTITFGCHPIAMNWQVRPLPPRACTFKPQNFYVGAVLNVITDAIILAIPIPMLWRLRIKLTKKIAIGLLICSGLFVITAAIVRAVLTLGSTPSGLNINRWGVRETIVGILTVNLPILRPMFKRSFWRSGGYVSDMTSYGQSRPTKNTYGHGTSQLRSKTGSKSTGRSDTDFVDIERSASGSSQVNLTDNGTGDISDGIVMIEQTINVSSRPRDEEDGQSDWSRDVGESGFKTNVTTGNNV
ncbi:hypothetical protein BU24DRAFT_381647 [Aaosphaeria arxii CBS 175.79]|uniref:Rhodopsin domain-containing protein n=1 Tax=Aaosphaeria arxii CBS 175.79 TaxID=1450172 RepID=A0A6A5X736_9PLEO|nr:uncharacterized protein BU24DRAFT_381647 [Aaosphaeria arxii CBS 175.79]KAF2008696.1 hypothetical protein BU24DRAFT_381647 [Aaosphaeria arxii CBS 175.79]